MMEEPWRQIMHIRVGSMHMQFTGGNAETSGSCNMAGREKGPVVRSDNGTRKIAPLRLQHITKSGEQATQSMSGEWTGKLQMRDSGCDKHSAKIVPA
jgi:hypothetical protein